MLLFDFHPKIQKLINLSKLIRIHHQKFFKTRGNFLYFHRRLKILKKFYFSYKFISSRMIVFSQINLRTYKHLKFWGFGVFFLGFWVSRIILVQFLVMNSNLMEYKPKMKNFIVKMVKRSYRHC